MSDASAALEEVALDIMGLGEAFAAVIESLSVEAFHARATSDAWSVAEIVGHASEFPLTFATKAFELSLSPGLAFGRALDDPGRLAAAARLRGNSPGEAAEFIRRTTREAAATVRKIEPAACVAVGRRLDGEEIAVSAILESMVRDHLKLHLRQARAAATTP
jgi:hypothetical protein